MAIGKALVALGVVIALIGVAWPLVSKIPLFRLPGDFVFGGERFRVHIPLATSLVISVAVSLVAWLLNR